MGRSIRELLAVEMALGHRPTSEVEVQQQHDVLVAKFRDVYGLTSRNAIEEAIRSHNVDEELLEEWIRIRQALAAFQGDAAAEA